MPNAALAGHEPLLRRGMIAVLALRTRRPQVRGEDTIGT